MRYLYIIFSSDAFSVDNSHAFKSKFIVALNLLEIFELKLCKSSNDLEHVNCLCL